MRLVVVAASILACGESATEVPEPVPPPKPVVVEKPKMRVDFGGRVFEPTYAAAYTRGGEAVVLALSSHRLNCERARESDAVDEHTATFELSRPLFDGLFPAGRDSATLADPSRWRLTGTALLDYRASLNSNQLSEDRDAVLEMPDELATRGGRVRIRYRGERFLYTTGEESGTKKPVTVEGEIEVNGCGDRPEVTMTEPMPIEVKIGKRVFPIRGALASRHEGRDWIDLSSLPRTCADTGSPGDLSLGFRESDPIYTNPKYISLGGTQSRKTTHTYKDTSKRTPARIPARGPFELAIGMDASPTNPVSIHGRVTVQRCKDW